MSGELQVRSTVGQGSLFWFTLTLPVVHEQQPQYDLLSVHPRILGFHGETRKILVVDDHLDNRMVLRDTLEPLGFELQEAENGQQALNMVKTCQPDAILMDLRMPGIDGFEATRRIRTMPGFEHAIIFGMSASHQNQQESLAAGCDRFLPKPIDRQQLLDALAKALQLTWIHENILAVSEHETLIAEMIPPSQEELATLHYLAVRGNLNRIRERIPYLEQKERYRPFAHRLTQLVNALEDKEIVNFVEHYMEELP